MNAMPESVGSEPKSSRMGESEPADPPIPTITSAGLAAPSGFGVAPSARLGRCVGTLSRDPRSDRSRPRGDRGCSGCRRAFFLVGTPHATRRSFASWNPGIAKAEAPDKDGHSGNPSFRRGISTDLWIRAQRRRN